LKIKTREASSYWMEMVLLASGGVGTLAVRRSETGLELTVCGERSIERRVLCTGDGELPSDLVTVGLLTLGVGGDGLLRGVSIKPVLHHQKDKPQCHNLTI
jgi:hypothetical protein